MSTWGNCTKILIKCLYLFQISNEIRNWILILIFDFDISHFKAKYFWTFLCHLTEDTADRFPYTHLYYFHHFPFSTMSESWDHTVCNLWLHSLRNMPWSFLLIFSWLDRELISFLHRIIFHYFLYFTLVWMYCDLFICSLSKGHLGCF